MVESLTAVFLTVLTSLFLFSGFANIRRGLHLSESHVNAAIVGRNLLNDARKTGFDELAPSSGSRVIEGENNGNPFYQKFDYTVDVQEIDSDKKLVWTTVKWNDANKTRKVVLETVIVQY